MAVLTNTMMQGTAAISEDTDYQISKSLRFNQTDTKLKQTFKNYGNPRVWTFATWFKNTKNTNGVCQIFGQDHCTLRIDGDEQISGNFRQEGSGTNHFVSWEPKIFDPTAWMHIVLSVDMTQDSEADRIRLWLNGEYITGNGALGRNVASKGAELNRGQADIITVGTSEDDGNWYTGYLADTFLIEGLSLAPTSFITQDATGTVVPLEFNLRQPNNASTWSNDVTTDTGSFRSGHLATVLFDGGTGTTCQSSSDSLGNWIKFEPTGGIPFSLLEAKQNGTTKVQYDWELEDGRKGVSTQASNGWGNVAPGICGTLKSLKVTMIGAAEYSETSAIRVDGLTILEDGVRQAETRVNHNDGLSWSDDYSGSTGTNHGFNGNPYDYTTPNADGNTVTWTPHKTITVNSSLRVFMDTANGSTMTVTFGDSSTHQWTGAAYSADWYDVPNAKGKTITSIAHNRASGNTSKLGAVEVDGCMLINSSLDQSWHLKYDDTSSNSAIGYSSIGGVGFDQTTSALPIYNTDTFGRTKTSGYRSDSSSSTLALAIPGDAFSDEHDHIKGSGSPLTITSVNGAVVSTDESKFYGSAIYCDGTDHFITIASNDVISDQAVSTVEMWVYFPAFPNNNAAGVIFTRGNHSSNNLELNIFNHGGTAKFYESWSSGTDWTGSGLSTNTWYHVAQVIQGSSTSDASATHKIYVDGILRVSNTVDLNSPAKGSYVAAMGCRYRGTTATLSPHFRFNDCRFYTSAKYTANFTPPTRNDFAVHNLVTNSSTKIYSGGVTLPSSGITGAATNLFDGDIMTYVNTSNSSDWIEIDLGSVAFSSTFELNGSGVYNQDFKFYHAGGTYTHSGHFGGNNQWVDFSSNLTSPVTKVEYKDSGGTGTPNVNAIRVDGTILVDSDLSDVTNDSPTNYEDDDGNVHGNFVTWNNLAAHSDITLKEGELEAHGPTSGSARPFGATMGVSSGKWYWEVKPTRTGNNNGGQNVGIALPSYEFTETTPPGDNSLSWGINGNDGDFRHNNSVVRTDYCLVGGAVDQKVLTTGNICMCALDMDNGKFWMGINGTWGSTSGGVGNPATGANAVVTSGLAGNTLIPVAFTGTDSGANNLRIISGVAGFNHTPPSGFKALCTQNLDDLFSGDNVNNPSKYFDAKIYDGTGDGTTNTFKGLNFQSDFSWFKRRGGSDISHVLYDAIRGTSNAIRANVGDGQSAFGDAVFTSTSDGFTISGSNTGGLNNTGDSMVGWFWDAGTAANGSVDSCSQTVNAQWTNPTAGFSVTSWEGGGGSGQTVAHGLGTKPDFFNTKRIDGSQDWMTYHSALGAEYLLCLNASDAKGDTTAAFNDTEPTNTIITYGSESRVGNTDTHITYAWTAIPGFSAFGSYTGNGSSNGPFVCLGFRPKWIMIKHTSAGAGWAINDAARERFNTSETSILADTAANEFTSSSFNVDFLSSGFKLRTSNANWNGDGIVYVYACFADHPFKTARAR